MKCKNRITKNDENQKKCGNYTTIGKNEIYAKVIKNKKYIFAGVLVVILLMVFLSNIYKKNDPKYDFKPKWMLTKPKKTSDYNAAKKYIAEKNKEYNTKFHIMGYGYHVHEITDEYELSMIYVYSNDYPQVYVSYCVNDRLCTSNSDNYLNKINAWKQKNMIYDEAKILGIDTNKIAIYVGISYNNSTITGDLIVNNSIDVETIEKLLSVVKKKYKYDSVSFLAYFVEKGNNYKYKDFMAGVGVNDEAKLGLNFGSWKKYKTVDYGVDVQLEFKWEHKK